MFEDKVKIYPLLKKHFSGYAVPSEIGAMSQLAYEEISEKLGVPFIIQFGRGWAGKTTFLIKHKKEFDELGKKFPFTKIKSAKFIDGFSVLNNCCIYNNNTLISQPAIQIDGIDELSDKIGVTCGRQWPVKFLDLTQINTINNISATVGNLMKDAGFEGFFGIDFMIEEKTGEVYLSEVNARMTASAPFFTLLQIGQDTIPLLAYHLAQFIGKKLPLQTQEENLVGSQVILRNPPHFSNIGNSQFGVFRNINSKISLIRQDYHPQNLADNDFIYIKNETEKKKDHQSEFARIECRCEVLENTHRLKKWMVKLFR